MSGTTIMLPTAAGDGEFTPGAATVETGSKPAVRAGKDSGASVASLTDTSPRIRVAGLYKIFGAEPRAALNLVREGSEYAEIQRQTGCTVAVRDVNFSVSSGEIFIVMGLSGSGKSTLVRCINRLIEPTSGRVFIDGEEASSFSPTQLRELRRRKVSMVFQNFALLPHWTVVQNVEYGLAIREEPKNVRREKALTSLELVGLRDCADKYPDTLSGGMKQRVGLARALSTDPEILLMDEPFSALDPLIRRDLQDQLLDLQRRLKKTIVFVTHDFHEAVKIGNRIAIMRQGEIVQIDTPQQIVLAPANEYVAGFARDVDRARILRAKDVMQPLEDHDFETFKLRRDVQHLDENQPIIDAYPLLACGLPIVVTGADNEPVGTLSAPDVLRCLSEPRVQGDAAGGQA